ncbi:MAG: adenine-specific methyltransferase EcoRI family protein [Helicobacteraceae bacterium]|jgi:hypothetical protein|nr:adenine-specific methyltransferase EcoRI family protein [Helicobacteraceae bacterium]
MANITLNNANKAKNDEFYTQIADVEKECKHYKEHFKGKTIFCNCDDPEQSAFWRYFHLNFELLGVKKLISTHFVYKDLYQAGDTYKMEYNGGADSDYTAGAKTTLKENGDFRSAECVELLKEADIVVTNPPFSLFREYVAQLMKYEKKFLIIGNKNALTYKEIFKFIKNDEIWTGYRGFSGGMWFITQHEVATTKIVDDKKLANVPSIWFTNMDIAKRHENLILYKTYTAREYPRYDNYDAINVDKTAEIPMDYDDIMGVPVTFLDKYNPDQFEIIGSMASTTIDEYSKGYPFIGGERKYARILIKRKSV